MRNKDFSILVIGAGAIGGITAGLLKKDGYNVEIVCKYNDYASLISTKGLNISGVCGNYSVKIPAYASVNEVNDKKDIILHATKATDMIDAAMALYSILKDDGYLISMQNGICEDELASVLGQNRIIGCVTGWGATMDNKGELVMTSSGDFILGYPDAAADHFLKQVAEILSSVVPVKVTDNIMGHLYSKLIINSCITSLGAICGLYLGEMLKIRKVRNIFIEIIKEAVAVADKMDLKIEVFGGKLDFRLFVRGDDIFSIMRRHLLIRMIGFKYRKLKSSSLQSLERGKLTEIDYLNGYIVKKGNSLGIPVPVNTAVVKLIHDIEDRKREITPVNFNIPLFNQFGQ